MKSRNKVILAALISFVTVQMLAPTVLQTVDVLSNDIALRRIIRERCMEA